MLNIVLKGHDYKYEVGVLLKAFGIFEIKFLNNDNGIVDRYNHRFFLINEITENSNECVISTKLIKDSKEVNNSKTIYDISQIIGEIEKRKKIKRYIKLSIYDALVNAGYEPLSWGILTGIRPTKIIHELLDKEQDIEDIKEILKNNYRLSEEKIELVTGIAICERKYIYPAQKDLISLYISIPFCPTRCVYCSFPSNPIGKNGNLIEEYLSALLIEVEETAKVVNSLGKKLETIYIGGGTPTTLSASQLDKLINKIYENFDTSKLKEFTVEAGRPDTITKDKLLVLKRNNIDRISINPQTMNQATLDVIGRLHEVEDIEDSYYEAKNIGFKTINMDIIVGLPNEGLNEIRNTMERVTKLSPDNLTIHTLAIKRSSKLKENTDDFMLKENLVNEMLNLTKSYTKKINLYPYYMYRQKYMLGNLENIGYCKEKHECVYNIQIMEERQTIIALGAGAVSKIAYSKENRFERVPNVKNLEDYIKRTMEMVERKKAQLII